MALGPENVNCGLRHAKHVHADKISLETSIINRCTFTAIANVYFIEKARNKLTKRLSIPLANT